MTSEHDLWQEFHRQACARQYCELIRLRRGSSTGAMLLCAVAAFLIGVAVGGWV